MSSSPPSSSVSSPAGRYAALVSGRRSKWIVLVVWLLLAMVGGTFAAKIGNVENNAPETWLPANAQATQAVKIAEKHFADKNNSNAVVVYVRNGGLTNDDLAKIAQDRAALASGIAHGPVTQQAVSGDNAAAYISFPLPSSPSDNNVLSDAVKKVAKVTETGAPKGLQVKVTGAAGTTADYLDVYSGMDVALLGAALLIVALILFATYRSPVLWIIPLLAVGVAAQLASGVVYLLAQHAGLTVNGESVYILMVLAVGIGTDYALLLIARYREELHQHTDRHEAMRIAVQRSLSTLTASAGTVALATLCLVFGSMNSTRSMGPVLAIGVAVVYVAMTSLLPALLVILGRWVFWPFVPRHAPGHQPTAAPKRNVWDRVAGAVGRRPRAVWLGTAGVLVALAFGAFTVQTGQTNAEQFRKPVDSVTGQQLLAKHFTAGSSAPADVYVPDADASSALTTLTGVTGVTGVDSATTQASQDGWTHITAVLRNAPDTSAARTTIQHMRAALAHDHAIVGGQTAVALDTAHAEGTEEAVLIPLILAVVFLLLVALLRAVVAPLILLASAALSFASAVGGAELLFRALGYPRIDQNLLLFGFLFLVALGIDYTMFLMTRAREEVAVLGHRDGILSALKVTGGVITSAGVVLAATFCVLATVPTVGALQQGLIVAVGVVLDTFLVRSLLIPAVSLHLGPRLWRPGRPEATAGYSIAAVVRQPERSAT